MSRSNGSDETALESLLGQIADDFDERHKRGEQPDIEDYAQRHPEIADVLREILPALNAMKPDKIRPGQQLDDFDLLLELGKGAFATVYLARQRSLQRLVAVKISGDQGTEPQTLAQLDHPFIVRLYDQRSLPEQRLHLLYMQYVAGGTLQDVIDRLRQDGDQRFTGRLLFETIDATLAARGETPAVFSAIRHELGERRWPEVVCWLGACLASALTYAHGHGVLHRDLKPANILLTAEGVPKLTDFNISFGSRLEGANAGVWFGGTIAYMSPEQLEAFHPSHPRQPDSLDNRSDLYALGIVLWELLTGRRPFVEGDSEENPTERLDKMLAQRRAGATPDLFQQLPPKRPLGLDTILHTCLEPTPDSRYASGAEMAQQLQLCLHPNTQRLLHAPPRSWRHTARRFPIVTLLLLALLPNALSGLFNYVYNKQEIIASIPESEPAFWTVQFVVNTTAFPLGSLLFVYLVWPVHRIIRTKARGRFSSTQDLKKQRSRCMRLGLSIAGISLATWLVAGLAYPISLHLLIGDIPMRAYFHFLTSMALCGLIAVAFSFLGVTFVSIRALYPALLPPAGNHSEECVALCRVGRWTWLHFLLAASVPLLAVTALVLIASESRFALGVLSASGLLGVGLAFWLCRSIENDIAALLPALRPATSLLPFDTSSFSG